LDAESRELFFQTLDRNLEVIWKVCSKLPDVSCTHLNFTEADFVPYYLQEYVINCHDACNIIYSADKDMLQCLAHENTFQYFKVAKQAKMISRDTMWQHFFKTEDHVPVSIDMFPIALAIIGDEGDGFSGPHILKTVKSGKQRKQGVGPVGLKNVLPLIEKITGGANQIFDNIEAGNSIWLKKPLDGLGSKDRKIMKLLYDQEDIVVRNIRLASYELLSRYVRENYPIDRIKLRESIESSVIDQNKIKSGRVLHAALDKAGLMPVVQEQTVYNLFL